MYLARIVSCGLCLSSHLSRFFIFRGTVMVMNSESSQSGDVSPIVAAAATTALSWGCSWAVVRAGCRAVSSRMGPWDEMAGVGRAVDATEDMVDGFLAMAG